MKLDEFIEATNRLENYYGKELSAEQSQIMFEELEKLNIERYRKLISKCLKTCKYMPKIADIIAANMELAGETEQEEKRQVIPCSKCDGSGYVLYTKYIANGNIRIPYTFATRCDCENAQYANTKVQMYKEFGIEISNRVNQVNDISRNIEQIKANFKKKFYV